MLALLIAACLWGEYCLLTRRGGNSARGSVTIFRATPRKLRIEYYEPVKKGYETIRGILILRAVEGPGFRGYRWREADSKASKWPHYFWIKDGDQTWNEVNIGEIDWEDGKPNEDPQELLAEIDPGDVICALLDPKYPEHDPDFPWWPMEPITGNRTIGFANELQFQGQQDIYVLVIVQMKVPQFPAMVWTEILNYRLQ